MPVDLASCAGLHLPWQGHEHGMIGHEVAQLFPQEELRFARQGGALVEHARDEVLLHRLRVIEGQQICRHAAADAIDPRVVHGGKTRMKAGGFQVVEGAQENLGRPPPKQRAAPPQDLAFHEAEVGAAQDEHDTAGARPHAVPQFLDDRGELGAGLGDPLELVQREDELALARKPLAHELEGGLPVGHAGLSQQGIPTARAAASRNSWSCARRRRVYRRSRARVCRT